MQDEVNLFPTNQGDPDAVVSAIHLDRAWALVSEPNETEYGGVFEFKASRRQVRHGACLSDVLLVCHKQNFAQRCLHVEIGRERQRQRRARPQVGRGREVAFVFRPKNKPSQ